MPEKQHPPSPTGVAAEQVMRRLTRRSFTVGAIAAATGLSSTALR